MHIDMNNLLHAAMVAATFGLVLALWLGVILLWSMKRSKRDKTIRERFQMQAESRDSKRALKLWHEGRETVINRPAFHRVPLLDRLEALFREAGWEIDAKAFAGGTGVTVVVAILLSKLTTGSFSPGICAVMVAGFALWFYIQKRISKRTALFEAQFVDALDIAARSLRAGHPLMGAFHLISEEIAAPVGTLFGQICQAQELGLSIEKAILEVAKSFNNADVRIFGTSISIQIRSGGNLADMMDRLAFVMRDRIRLSRRVRVLTAQTQFSKRILAVLPIFIFVTLNTLNPTYMLPLYTTDLGKGMLVVASVCILIGVWVMNKMSRITY
jgi:tight adherence protein B